MYTLAFRVVLSTQGSFEVLWINIIKVVIVNRSYTPTVGVFQEFGYIYSLSHFILCFEKCARVS